MNKYVGLLLLGLSSTATSAPQLVIDSIVAGEGSGDRRNYDVTYTWSGGGGGDYVEHRSDMPPEGRVLRSYPALCHGRAGHVTSSGLGPRLSEFTNTGRRTAFRDAYLTSSQTRTVTVQLATYITNYTPCISFFNGLSSHTDNQFFGPAVTLPEPKPACSITSGDLNLNHGSIDFSDGAYHQSTPANLSVACTQPANVKLSVQGEQDIAIPNQPLSTTIRFDGNGHRMTMNGVTNRTVAVDSMLFRTGPGGGGAFSASSVLLLDIL